MHRSPETQLIVNTREKVDGLPLDKLQATRDDLLKQVKAYPIDCAAKELLTRLAVKHPAKSFVAFMTGARESCNAGRGVVPSVLRLMTDTDGCPIFNELCEELKRTEKFKAPQHIDNHPETERQQQFTRGQFIKNSVLALMGTSVSIGSVTIAPPQMSKGGKVATAATGTAAACYGGKNILESRDMVMMRRLMESLNPQVEQALGIDQNEPCTAPARAAAPRAHAL